MDGRIFGLDIQLGFDVIMQGIAVFIMFALLSYILFEPVRKILEDRKNRIADEIDQAAADQAEAAKLKAEYDHKLKNVEKEADALMAQARKKALKREEEIVAGAKEEAARIIEGANHEAELARINAQDQMKQEMVKMAVLMAGKFIQNQMDEKDQNAFVRSFGRGESCQRNLRFQHRFREFPKSSPDHKRREDGGSKERF